MIGRKVLVPHEIWPEEKLPKGQKGWTGKISGVSV